MLVKATDAISAYADTTRTLKQNRDFQLLLRGSSVSMLGSQLSTIAFPLLILAMTGSVEIAGWAGFAAAGPSILVYLPAGALVDRYNPRIVMIVSEIGRCAVIAVVVAGLALGVRSVPALIVVIGLEEILEIFSVLAERRYVRAVVRPDQGPPALIRSEARTHLVVLAGRPLGGLLFGFGRIVPFAANLLSSGVILTALFRVSNNWEPGQFQSVKERYLIGEIRDGFKWLWQYRFAGMALPLTAVATLISQALIMVFLAAAHQRQSSPASIGLVLAASGGGGVLGCLASSWLFPWLGSKLLPLQMAVWALAFGWLAVFGGESFFCIAVAMFVFGFTGALGNIARDAYLNLHTGQLLGRIMSIDRLTSFGAMALGPLLGAILAHQYGTRTSIYALWGLTGAFLTLPAVVPYFFRHRLAGPRGRTAAQPASP